MLFDKTFEAELGALGYEDVGTHLQSIRDARNDFMHGDPQSISDEIVTATAVQFPRFRQAWIAAYN